MGSGIKQFKPGVGRRTHVLLAALLWTGIGLFLILRGITLALGFTFLWPVWTGLFVGTIKSVFILDQAAYGGLDRIKRFADNTCIGAVYSWKTWILVLGMMIFGICLRRLDLAPEMRSVVCSAIGWALMFSSRHAWKLWLTWKTTSQIK